MAYQKEIKKIMDKIEMSKLFDKIPKDKKFSAKDVKQLLIRFADGIMKELIKEAPKHFELKKDGSKKDERAHKKKSK